MFKSDKLQQERIIRWTGVGKIKKKYGPRGDVQAMPIFNSHKTANGKYKDLASQAGYLIGRGVDLIVATGGIVAAQAAAHAAAQAD